MREPSLDSRLLLRVCLRDPFWALSCSPFILMKLCLPYIAAKPICTDHTILHCIADSVQLAIEKTQLSFHALQHSFINLRLILNTNKNKIYDFFQDLKTQTRVICISLLSMVQTPKGLQNTNTLAFGSTTNLSSQIPIRWGCNFQKCCWFHTWAFRLNLPLSPEIYYSWWLQYSPLYPLW